MFAKIERFAERARFWAFESRRLPAGPRLAVPSNDNLPGFRRPADGRRPRPNPTLACHWYLIGGRLQCRWEFERADDSLTADRKAEPTLEPEGLRPQRLLAACGRVRE